MYWYYLSVSFLLSKVHIKLFFGLLSVVYSSTYKSPLLDFTRLRICLVSTSQWSTTNPTILKIRATSNCFLGDIFQFLLLDYYLSISIIGKSANLVVPVCRAKIIASLQDIPFVGRASSFECLARLYEWNDNIIRGLGLSQKGNLTKCIIL